MNGVNPLRSWAGVCIYTEADEGIDRERHSPYRLQEASSPPFTIYQLQEDKSSTPRVGLKHANTFPFDQRSQV